MTVALRCVSCILATCTVACLLEDAASARVDRQQFSTDKVGAPTLVARTSATVMQLYDDDEAAAPQFDGVALPANLVLADHFRDIIQSMLHDSPTFRRQCARLSAAPHLSVTVEYGLLTASNWSRATTVLANRPDGRLSARVLLGQTTDREELLAHEFEHIIEQLDGVDLPSLAKHAAAGVRLTPDAGRFETERAVAVGKQVAREIRAARRPE
jgi:hypothetical protein